MWFNLPVTQREYYQKLITNFASLSEVFAQKAEDNTSVAPIVNSKYQEAAFQYAFHATIEDIANTSYDASLHLENGEKYIIGIKSFGIDSGAQKIAQFKSDSKAWLEYIVQIKKNAENCQTIEEVNKVNYDLYLKLAKKIAVIRNRRILSSIENLKGFDVNKDTKVESVYHVLMPSKKGDIPTIHVGETQYHMISIEDIKILGCTSYKNPSNFSFIDKKTGCEYKYTSSDSQLYMKFCNKEIIQESWPITYVQDAFRFFENIEQETPKYESHSWKINVQPYSGYNAFYGLGSKLGRSIRNTRIEQVLTHVNNHQEKEYLDDSLKKILLDRDIDTSEKERLRDEVMNTIKENKNLTKQVSKLLYRPMNEMYIPIPNAQKFHKMYPSFFGPLSDTGSSKPFSLVFLPSGDEIESQVRQQGGKAIQSTKSQGVLGEWILRHVFQLNAYEPLTEQRLEELRINGIRLTKRDDKIYLEFIWIEDGHEPEDYWNA